MREQLSESKGLLPKACVCGHDHTTHRGEEVYMCLECSCSERIDRCQNCGEETPLMGGETTIGGRRYDVCSRRCALQLEHAVALAGAER